MLPMKICVYILILFLCIVMYRAIQIYNTVHAYVGVIIKKNPKFL